MSYRAEVDKYLARMGQLGPLDRGGQCTLIKGESRLELSVGEGDGALLTIRCPVLRLPRENVLPLFRRLLALNLETTGAAAFALDESTNYVYLILQRPAEGLDFGEFRAAIESVADTAERQRATLAADFGASLVPSVRRTSTLQNYLSAVNLVPRSAWRRRWPTVVAGVAAFGAAAGCSLWAHATQPTAIWIFIAVWSGWTALALTLSVPNEPFPVKRTALFVLWAVTGIGLVLLLQWLIGRAWLAILLAALGGLLLPPVFAALAWPELSAEDAKARGQWAGGRATSWPE